MAEVIVDRYVIETQEAQKNLQAVNNSLTEISNKSKKTSAQMNTDFTNAARGGAALTKQYNGLNVAVSQFARELPNAAQSAQIFFMSIGNNFGQLQDAISRINAQNKELAAQGQKTIPLFKQIASSILSVNTVINIGVLLLVLYGKEIGNFITSLFKGEKAINAATERFDDLNKALASKELSGAIKNIELLRVNISLARQGFLDKNTVLFQYNESIGKVTGSVDTLDQAEQELVKNAPAYIQMIVLKTAAEIAADKAASATLEQRQKVLERERNIVKERTRLSNEEADQIERARQNWLGSGGSIDNPIYQKRIADIKAFYANIRNRVTDEELNHEIIALEQSKNEQLRLIGEFQSQATAIAKNNKFIFDPTGDAAAKAAREKAEREAIENLREFWRLYEIEAEKVRPKLRAPSQIEAAPAPFSNAELRNSVAEGISITEISINDLLGRLFEARKKGQTDYTKFLEAELKRRVDAVANAAKDEEEIQKINAKGIIEIQQQLSDGIFQLRSAYAKQATDSQIEQIEKEREVQLENDNLTAEQRVAIQEEFDRKRAEILNKNARIQRQYDLGQILVNTALAVMRVLATATNPATGVILANLAAIEGAIQFGLAAAQPLPQFAKGTERVTGGEKGRDSVHALLMPDEAVITANENMRHPGLARAWNAGKLEQFLAMKYIEPILNEVYSKDAAKINNQFINNNKVSGINDKRIVKSMQENTAVNRLVLKEIRGKNSGRSDRRIWN